jgi:hypothetical protein
MRYWKSNWINFQVRDKKGGLYYLRVTILFILFQDKNICRDQSIRKKILLKKEYLINLPK